MLSKTPAALDAALLARFAAIVGEKHAITDPQAQAPYLIEQRDLFHGHTPVVLRPGTVAEVAQILRLANETGTPPSSRREEHQGSWEVKLRTTAKSCSRSIVSTASASWIPCPTP